MKVGIIANHRAHNFGTVLQSYALYTQIKKLGCKVEFIDYWPHYKKNQYSLLRWSHYFDPSLSFGYRLLSWLKRLLSFPERLIRYTKFNLFINKHISFSKHTYRKGKTLPDKYDLIIFTGEIWKYQKLRGRILFDEVYVGDFPKMGKAKKIAYATGAGGDEMNKYVLEKLAKYLANFKAVSLREESLVHQIGEYSSVPAVHVLDPVFLLTADEWRDLIKAEPPRKPYLLFYQQMKSDEAAKLARKIAKEKGLQVIEIRGYISRPLWFKKIKTTAGPIDFITLMANADYVVSTSFHGVAFAIIFEKQFSALGLKNNGVHVRELLKALGIEKSVVQKDLSDYYDGVDYSYVHVRLKRWREESRKFLVTNIGQDTIKLHQHSTAKMNLSS